MTLPPSTLLQSLYQLAVDKSTQQDQVQMVISKHANSLQKYGKSTSRYKGAVTWKVICPNIRKIASLNYFKKSLKNEFIN